MAKRADAQRNLGALLEAAKAVFMSKGIDAPVREIAKKAGVGVGTVYRHFPQRYDLITAVLRREVDVLADAARVLAEEEEPFEAFTAWLRRYTRFVATKRGLAKALHSGDPAFASMPAYFDEHVGPALKSLLTAAAAAGEIRGDVDPSDLLRAVSSLCSGDEAHSQRMVALLIDGLRFGTKRTKRRVSGRAS